MFFVPSCDSLTIRKINIITTFQFVFPSRGKRVWIYCHILDDFGNAFCAFDLSNQIRSNHSVARLPSLHQMMSSYLCEQLRSGEWLRAQLIAPINNSGSNLCLESRQKCVIYGLVTVMRWLASVCFCSLSLKERWNICSPTYHLNSLLTLMFTDSAGGILLM